jgi:hypothetical protein
MKVTDEILAVEKAARLAGGEPEEKLRAKCNWEHMSRTAVIKTWGDPREWK